LPETKRPSPASISAERAGPGIHMESTLLYISANPFGMLRVVFDPAWNAHVLLSGATRQGMQSVDPARSAEPLSYYHRTGPLGDIFSAWKPPAGGGRVGILGLGVGCLAAYATPGQRFTFYEINPDVVKVAADSRYFTYLSQCRGTSEIVLGDGRESLERTPDQTFDLLILDAFQDDAPPPHLVSPDAVRMYLRKLTAAGLLVIHIDPRGAVPPDLKRLAAQENLVCLLRADVQMSAAERAAGKLQSCYLVLSRDPVSVRALSQNPTWTAP